MRRSLDAFPRLPSSNLMYVQYTKFTLGPGAEILSRKKKRDSPPLMSIATYFSPRRVRAPRSVSWHLSIIDHLPLFGLQWVLRSFIGQLDRFARYTGAPETATIFYHHMCDRVGGCRSGYSFVSVIDVFLLLHLVIARARSVAYKKRNFRRWRFSFIFFPKAYARKLLAGSDIDLLAKKRNEKFDVKTDILVIHLT